MQVETEELPNSEVALSFEIEDSRLQRAMDVIATGVPRLMHVDLTADETSESGDVCGGIMDVFIEPLRFSPMNDA